jgi:hypothetical protein
MKETLEEAKLRQLFKNRSNCYADADDVIQAMDENCFIETIKEWEQERMYSEEDLRKAFSGGRTVYNYKSEWEETYNDNMTSSKFENFDKWFEQFKNK